MAVIAGVVVGVITAASSIYSSISEKKHRKKEIARLLKKQRQALAAKAAIEGTSLQQQEALVRKEIDQRLAGYDKAQKEASHLGKTEKQRILDSARKQAASTKQNLTDRGLGSITGGVDRGIAADTTRQFQGINESLAGIYGNLSLGRAGVEAQGTQQLRGLNDRFSQLMSGIAQEGAYGVDNFMQDRIPNAGDALISGHLAGLGGYTGAGGTFGLNTRRPSSTSTAPAAAPATSTPAAT